MSQDNNIRKLLNIKDENVKFYENWCENEIINGKNCTIINSYLSYVPNYCDNCGCIFESTNDYEKKGFLNKPSYIVIPSISKMTSYLKLRKQRIKCLHCNSSFTCSSPIINYGCFISNNTKYSIALDLSKKISEKDISSFNNVSPNTVERVMDSYYNTQPLYKHNLPTVLSFDEFKSVKSADGAMSFHMCDGETGKTIDIIEDRKLISLLKYFTYYSHETRSRVNFIVIDMYSPYISLINKMFPNAKIIIDKFHLTQLISRSLNKTRIMAMKNDKKNYNKMKRYWKLVLKSRDELNCSKWRKFTCFPNLMTEVDVVDYIVNSNQKLKNTYQAYQDLLYAFQHNDIDILKQSLNNDYRCISEYMKTSINTLKEFVPYINNTFNNKYHNGFIEGNNNFIKVIKRIAFGFRSFKRFKTRILICKNLLFCKLKEA